MSLFVDLRPLFEGWPYDPDHSVRIARAPDGRDIMQVRTPLGLEQYELDGRPDGRHPYGRASVLDHQLQRLAEARRVGKEDAFRLTAEECAELFVEGTLYYSRYLHLFQLRRWDLVVRDTARNLALFDLVHRHALRQADRMQLEQWRPYLIRMNAVATARVAMDQADYAAARATVEAGLRAIESLEELNEGVFSVERQRSLGVLREMLDEIEKNRPLSETERLERELQRAIDSQAFERAATIRDRLRALRSPP
jgi:hypothetical protein